LSDIGAYQIQEEELLASIDATRATALNDCETTLNALPQSTLYEVNQVYLDRIKYARRQSLNTGELSQLKSIAMQCPDVAGNTRSTATNWLTPGNLARQVWETGFAPVCDAGVRDAKANTTRLSDPCVLWPNPVESVVNIGFNFNFSGAIRVCSVNEPKPLLSSLLTGVNETQVNTQHLPAGVYVLMAKSNDGRTFSRKFVVIK